MSRGREPRGRPIVVAVDLSDGSEVLVEAALSLTHTDRAPILLVHVVRDLRDVFDPYVSSVPLERLQGELTLDGKAWLGRLRRDCFGNDSRAREILVSGTPWSAIVDTARRNRAEFIVIGSSGPRGVTADVERLQRACAAPLEDIGSTTARVVRYAPCSVMVVPTTPPGEAR